MSGRTGDWMQTYRGRQFWPMDPRAAEVELDDIAHALSMQCRFAGHTTYFYSVAEHCVHLASAVPAEHALWALLHDASEAYLVDVPRPVKPSLTGYLQAEARVMAAVCDRFGLDRAMPAAVRHADVGILTDERIQAMASPPAPWITDGPGLGIRLQFWSPRQAEAEFIKAFQRLSAVRDSLNNWGWAPR